MNSSRLVNPDVDNVDTVGSQLKKYCKLAKQEETIRNHQKTGFGYD